MDHAMYSVPLALIGLLCPFAILALFVYIAIKIARAFQARSVGAPPVAERRVKNVTTELGADGFWILSCPAAPLSVIHYYYWSAGARHAASVPYEPGSDGRQFVYTGLRPEHVSISRIVEPGGVSTAPAPLDVLPGVIAAEAVFNSMEPDEPPPAPEPPRFPAAY